MWSVSYRSQSAARPTICASTYARAQACSAATPPACRWLAWGSHWMPWSGLLVLVIVQYPLIEADETVERC